MPPPQRRGITFSSNASLPRTYYGRGTRSQPRFSAVASATSAVNSRPSSRSNGKTTDHGSSRPSTVTPDSLIITLPVPPSINHQYATVNGRRLLSSTGRAYKAHVGQEMWIVLAQSPSTPSFQGRIQSCALSLSIRFFFATSLRRDLDGGLKIAQDAICEGLGINDNRIIETHLYKHVDKTAPRIEVSLSCLSSSQHKS